MKQNTCLIGLLQILLFIAGNAQPIYHPFPAVAAHWIYQYYDDFHQPYGSYHEYQLAGDTLIGMTVYSKIHDRNAYAGGVREQQGMVWFYPDTGTAEYLLYDFNLVTGDTTTGIYGGTVFGPSDTVQVVYDDSVPSADGLRHRIWFSNGAQWIEGIGSNNYLLAPLLFAGLSGNDYLECFRNDSLTVVPLGASGCFTGIPEVQDKDERIMILPNPVRSVSYILLDAGQLLQSWTLFDMSGKEVEGVSSRNVSTTFIDRSGIPDGAYVLKIVLADGRTVRKRMIIAGGD